MSNEIINKIAHLVEGMFRKRQSVPLHELFWTIDAQLHVIVSEKEINEALELVQPVEIKRNDGGIELVPCTVQGEATITKADVDTAAAIYNNYVSVFIAKRVERNPNRPLDETVQLP